MRCRYHRDVRRHLDDDADSGFEQAQSDHRIDDTLATDDCRFDGLAISQHDKQGQDSSQWKIHLPNAVIGFVQYMARWQ
jgi:hypothetical protein